MTESGDTYADEIEHSVIAAKFPGETISIQTTCTFEYHDPISAAVVDRAGTVDLALFGSDTFTGLRAANLIRDRIKILKLEIEAAERLLEPFDGNPKSEKTASG